MKTLEGGCTAPIGAIAQIINDKIQFKGALFSLDGVTKLEIEKSVSINEFEDFGKKCALEILENGGKEVMESIRTKL